MATKKTTPAFVSPYPMVEVQWEDAETSHGWEAEGESELDLPTVCSIGYLIDDKPAGVRIATTVGLDKSNNGRMSIPRKMIKSYRVIKAVTVRPKEKK